MNEADRLRALTELDLLDTLPEEEFDQLVRLASQICSTPISLVSLVDQHRQWFKASVGLDVRETPREVSFCAHAIQSSDLFVVEDASKDVRFSENSLVTGELGIRFYAGLPLQTLSGALIGTLCVIDTVPRELTQDQRNALMTLGLQVQARIEMREKQRALEIALAENSRLNSRLQEANALFYAFMDAGPFLSYMKDDAGRFVFYNRQMNEKFGLSGQEWIGKSVHDLFPQALAKKFSEDDLVVRTGGLPIETFETTPGRDGSLTHWRTIKFPFRSQRGEAMLAGFSIDVTEETRQKNHLKVALEEKTILAQSFEASRALFRTFADLNPGHCFLKTLEGKYIFYNRSFADYFGISDSEWIGRSSCEVLPPGLAAMTRSHDAAALQRSGPVERSGAFINAKGESRNFKSLKFTYTDTDGQRMIAGIEFDITEDVMREKALRAANDALELLATTDALTGLPNRRVFEARGEAELQSSLRKQRSLAVLVLDVDDFKKRNDSLGHQAGDDALRALGKVLRSCCRANDLPARLGGEEFGILLPETDSIQARNVALRIQEELQFLSVGTLPLTVSIGTACTDACGTQWLQLTKTADQAMYAAKRAGKNCVVLAQASPKRSRRLSTPKTAAADENEAANDGNGVLPN